AEIIGSDKRYSVCGSAHSFADGNRLIKQFNPELLLIEPFLEEGDGVRWIRELAKEFPRMRILVVSRHSEEMFAERVLRAGAAGYWMKNSPIEELMKAISTVLSGAVYVSPSVASWAVQQLAGRGRSDHRLSVLSDREFAVFTQIGVGRRIGEIARELGISRKTVETHCEHIKQKLGYSNAEELKSGARRSLSPNGA